MAPEGRHLNQHGDVNSGFKGVAIVFTALEALLERLCEGRWRVFSRQLITPRNGC